MDTESIKQLRTKEDKMNRVELVDNKTVKVYLTQDQYTILDREDWDRISHYSFHASYYKNIKGYYCNTSIRNESTGKQIIIGMHRLILNTVSDDKSVSSDHINRDTLDNRRCNLRIDTCNRNYFNRNKHSNNTTGYKGVSTLKRREKLYYVTSIMYNGNKRHLGCFSHDPDGLIKAALAYNEAALKYHGEYANLNVIEKVAV